MPLPQESPYFAGTKKQFMNRYRILAGIFCLLATGNVLAEEADTLKVVDVEEITVIATPKENRKLREQPTAVTLLSQQDMQNWWLSGSKASGLFTSYITMLMATVYFASLIFFVLEHKVNPMVTDYWSALRFVPDALYL